MPTADVGAALAALGAGDQDGGAIGSGMGIGHRSCSPPSRRRAGGCCTRPRPSATSTPSWVTRDAHVADAVALAHQLGLGAQGPARPAGSRKSTRRSTVETDSSSASADQAARPPAVSISVDSTPPCTRRPAHVADEARDARAAPAPPCPRATDSPRMPSSRLKGTTCSMMRRGSARARCRAGSCRLLAGVMMPRARPRGRPPGAPPGARAPSRCGSWVEKMNVVPARRLISSIRSMMASPVVGVEVGGGLVGQHDRRVRDQRARHRHPLALAARQLVGAVVRELAQAHLRPARAGRARAPRRARRRRGGTAAGTPRSRAPRAPGSG